MKRLHGLAALMAAVLLLTLGSCTKDPRDEEIAQLKRENQELKIALDEQSSFSHVLTHVLVGAGLGCAATLYVFAWSRRKRRDNFETPPAPNEERPISRFDTDDRKVV